eukprot:9969329-Prorocentrum_lima.AAC.1
MPLVRLREGTDHCRGKKKATTRRAETEREEPRRSREAKQRVHLSHARAQSRLFLSWVVGANG